MSEGKSKIEEANALREQASEDKMVAFAKTFSGQATPEQAAKCLALIKRWCLADECPAHYANFETNRTNYNAGRQAVWREMEAAMNPQTEKTKQ